MSWDHQKECPLAYVTQRAPAQFHHHGQSERWLLVTPSSTRSLASALPRDVSQLPQKCYQQASRHDVKNNYRRKESSIQSWLSSKISFSKTDL